MVCRRTCGPYRIYGPCSSGAGRRPRPVNVGPLFGGRHLALAWLKRRRELRRSLPDEVAAVARKVRNRLALEAAARDVAERFGPSAVGVLRDHLHKAPARPTEFEYPNAPLGAWLSAWQFASFEVLCHLREPALKFVREVAFGAYDWTQGNAIEVLCRWAVEGLDRERTVRDLRYEATRMRPEALDCAVGPLLSRAVGNRALQELIDELRSIPEFEQACKDAGRPAGG